MEEMVRETVHLIKGASMSDRRERNHKWYSRFDERRMVIIIEQGDGEEVEIPAKYEVCDTCNGKGKHVNPAIDSQGLSADDFAEDPGFFEDYMSGVYDQPCVECHGERVVPVLDEARATKAEIELATKTEDDWYQYQAEIAAERRMGY